MPSFHQPTQHSTCVHIRACVDPTQEGKLLPWHFMIQAKTTAPASAASTHLVGGRGLHVCCGRRPPLQPSDWGAALLPAWGPANQTLGPGNGSGLEGLPCSRLTAQQTSIGNQKNGSWQCSIYVHLYNNLGLRTKRRSVISSSAAA